MSLISPDALAAVRHAYSTNDIDFESYAGLSDESVFALLDSRMRDLDTQIGSYTRDLQDRSTEAQRLSVEVTKMQAVREVLGNRALLNDDGSFNTTAEIDVGQVRELAARLGIDDVDAFVRTFDSDASDGRGTLTVADFARGLSVNGESLAGLNDPSQLQSRSDSLGELLRQCNSGNEQTMVRLQSCMQQRTQVVTMATNLLKAMDESRDAVVGNLR